MPKRTFHRWVILTVSLYQGQLWIEYEDETGERRPIPSSVEGRSIPDGWAQIFGTHSFLPPFIIPHDLLSLLESGYKDISDRRYHSRSTTSDLQVPWLLPVFVDPPAGLEALHWEDLLSSVIAIPQRCVTIRLTRRRYRLRAPAQLPLKVLDASYPNGHWLDEMKARSWYAGNDIVREYGLHLERLKQHQRQTSGSLILLSRLNDAGRQIRTAREMRTSTTRPRLFVVFTHAQINEALTRLAGKIPKGCSLLIIVQPTPFEEYDDTLIGSIVKEVLYAVVHDFALHELIYIVKRTFPGLSAFLASDPAANQDLRMSRAMRRLVDRSLELSHPVLAGDLDAFVGRLGENLASSVRPYMEAAQSRWTDITTINAEANYLALDFSRETSGFVPMANFMPRFGTARHSVSRLAKRLKALQPDSKTLHEVSRHQVRRADIVLEEYDVFGVLRPMDEYDRKVPLRSGWPYRLRLHIGQRDQYSAVEGDVPAIDPLLPAIDEKDSHELQVVVFPKSFKLLSPSLQKLKLPKMSGSKPVYFELQTPDESGPAELRIALYHRNNLLQSFVFEASVAEASNRTWQEKPQVLIRLTFSSTARFDNLAELGDPAMSIALNQDLHTRTHTLMFKKDNIRQGQFVTEDQIKKLMGRFRDLLEQASPQFPIDVRPTAQGREDFDVYIRKFAQLGANIWKMLMEGADKNVCDALEAMLLTESETIQFVRHGKNLHFPWQLVYDYKLPEGDAFLNARVCHAREAPRQPASRLVKGCPHCPGEDVICIEGFWSVRHYIEQLSEQSLQTELSQPGPGHEEPLLEDRVTTITLPANNPLVCLGVGVDDQVTRTFSIQLDKKLGNNLKLLSPTEDLLTDVLWKESARPGLLIVLSHLEPADETRNLPARILPVVSHAGSRTGSHLTGTRLLDAKTHFKKWNAHPRSLVLLMACQSAKTELSDLTNFMDTFLGCGAAGIVGTENAVSSDLASSFAEHVVFGLAVDGLNLGETFRSYTTMMLRKSNPLPFSFTVIGSAKLNIVKGNG